MEDVLGSLGDVESDGEVVGDDGVFGQSGGELGLVGLPNLQSHADKNVGRTPVSCTVSDDNHCLITSSPGGGTYWTPLCSKDSTPSVNQFFQTIEDGIKFYREYAASCNFEVRLGKQYLSQNSGALLKKYVLCNKEGTSRVRAVDSMCSSSSGPARVLSMNRCGCKAKILLVKGRGGYLISDFVSAHNHEIATPMGAQFMKCRRSLSFAQMSLLAACGRANIGPSGAFNIAKEIAGGFENVGALKKDFQNHQRDKDVYVGINDAQMVIDRFTNKKQNSSDFFFEYCTEDNALTRLFWADPIARRNFRAYGDVVSFDATYSLNRYRLVFIPFTGVDNHLNSITFGAGLLSGEDEESYTWLLEAFMKCMGRAPHVVLTDEDSTVRLAILKVMKGTHHRLCMWHIMKKLPVKIPLVTDSQLLFSKSVKNLIYDYHVDVTEFEDKWHALMEQYNMGDHTWLRERFEKRESWIPCYFKDIPLGGLLRTTSRSESANSFFGGFLKKGLNLLGFIFGFDSAMDSQRNTQAKCDHETRMKYPSLRTPLELEKQAAEVYTGSVFKQFQKEIVASGFEVSILRVLERDGTTTFVLKDQRYIHRTFEVKFCGDQEMYVCSCKLFEKVGFLCRHVLSCFKSVGISTLSSKYILERWTRHAIIYANEALEVNILQQVNYTPTRHEESSDIWLEYKSCLEHVGNDVCKKDYMLALVKDMRAKLETMGDVQQRDKSDVIGELVGAELPAEVTIYPPKYVYTKGSGKRIIGDAEKALAKAKRKRLCVNCRKPGHNTRTCPANSQSCAGGSDSM